jgi:hypothetical protein
MHVLKGGIQNMGMLNIRLSDDESRQIERFRQRLQEQYGTKVRVTQKTVILTALEHLETALEPDEQEHHSTPAPHEERRLNGAHGQNGDHSLNGEHRLNGHMSEQEDRS